MIPMTVESPGTVNQGLSGTQCMRLIRLPLNVMVCEQPGSISSLMQSLGRRYVRYVNQAYHRTGTLRPEVDQDVEPS